MDRRSAWDTGKSRQSMEFGYAGRSILLVAYSLITAAVANRSRKYLFISLGWNSQNSLWSLGG